MIEALLLDLSGVLYNTDTIIPGALQAVEVAQRSGLEVRFVTNTSQVMRVKSVTLSTPLIR